MVGAFSVATRRIQANDTKGHEASVQGNFHMVIAGGELDASRGLQADKISSRVKNVWKYNMHGRSSYIVSRCTPGVVLQHMPP